tara:strand:- start:49589 stop:50956 length:1368 start_codon:yes stop_codon:yes gene_type:complete
LATDVTLSASQLLSPLLTDYPNAQRWVVAYSGGVDSLVLLHLCHTFLAQQSVQALPELCAVHINHGLQAPALQWAQQCQQQAQAWSVRLHVEAVSINKQPRQSLEDQARQARYQVFEKLLQPGDLLLQGHHSNDQAETLLLRLLRGSGSQGLGAMPAARPLAAGVLVRPLLAVSRSDIEAYAQQQQLQWIEDPSNQSSDYDRNFLRLELLPKLAQRWPQVLESFSRSARLSAESYQLNQELAAIDAQALADEAADAYGAGLAIAGLKKLTAARGKNLLRYWLAQQQLAMPSEAQLLAVMATVINAQADASPTVSWPGVEVCRYEGRLYAHAPLPDFTAGSQCRWDLRSAITLAGAGALSVKSCTDGALRLPAGVSAADVTIRFRQGGEQCRPAGRGGSRKLKKLLQELAVPYWLRQRVPLIYCGDELIAVADMVVAEGWQAAAGEPGWQIQWQRP